MLSICTFGNRNESARTIPHVLRRLFLEFQALLWLERKVAHSSPNSLRRSARPTCAKASFLESACAPESAENRLPSGALCCSAIRKESSTREKHFPGVSHKQFAKALVAAGTLEAFHELLVGQRWRFTCLNAPGWRIPHDFSAKFRIWRHHITGCAQRRVSSTRQQYQSAVPLSTRWRSVAPQRYQGYWRCRRRARRALVARRGSTPATILMGS
jgi:hypothetical protein